MIPAHALAAELKGRGYGVLLITDDRGARFPGLFEGMPVHILPAGRLGGGPVGWLKAFGSVVKVISHPQQRRVCAHYAWARLRVPRRISRGGSCR